MKSLFSSLLFLCAALGAAVAVHGEMLGATGTVVRVGFCPERGTYERLESGVRVGVGPEWMRRIAARLQWNVEWVELSYEEGERQVASGEIDVLGGVAKTPEIEAELVLTTQPMGVRRHVLYVLKSSPFERLDAALLNGCRLGVVKGCPRTAPLLDHLAAQGIRCTLVEYADACQTERGLFRGEVGMVYLDPTVNLAAERELYEDIPRPLYFATARNRPRLAAELQGAMEDILDIEPQLAWNLRKNYFPFERAALVSFTLAERNWIAERVRAERAFTLAMSPHDPLFATYSEKDGRLSGFFGMLLDEVEDLTGLHSESQPPASSEMTRTRFANGDTDVLLTHNLEKPPADLSAPVFTLTLPDASCSRRYDNHDVADAQERIAVWCGDRDRLAAYARLGYETRLVFCETREDCFRVVADGRADVTYHPYWVARRLIQELDLSKTLDVKLAEGQLYEPSLSIHLRPQLDSTAATIVGKVVASLTRKRLVEIVHRAEARERPAPRLTLEQKLLWWGVPFLAVLFTGFWWKVLSGRRLKRALLKTERSLQVADSALIEANHARREMREARDRAEFIARSRTNFLATMSHEIRTPLNAVVGFSEFLRDADLPVEKRQEYVCGISDSAHALLSLLNDILDISKFESGRKDGLDIRSEVCDVEALCREMTNIFSIQGREKGIDVSFKTTAPIPRLRLAEPRLRQILLNLVGNAVKFTDHGSVTATVAYADGVFHLDVVDTGIGISERGKKLIFDPFSQDMESRRGKMYAGTGLGLSIVKRLVEASDGTVTVQSEMGKGSTFSVEIPGVEALPPPKEEAEATVSFTDAFKHVLVVDDTKMNCRVLATYCQKLGLEDVRTFSSAAEVLTFLDGGGAADLVLTDLWMPVMNGSELAHEIVRRMPDVPIVAVSADTDASARFDMGVFNDVLAKPVTAQKIRALFTRLVSNT